MRKIWDGMAERLPSPEKEVCMISAGPHSLGQRHRPALSPRQTAGAVGLKLDFFSVYKDYHFIVNYFE